MLIPTIYKDRATLLEADAVTGEFTVVVLTGLVCRFVHLAAGGASASERAELLRMRRLLWEPGVSLPSPWLAVRDEATNELWHTVPGTQAIGYLLGKEQHRSIDLVAAEAA